MSYIRSSSYHNRFRTSSSDGADSHCTLTSPPLHSVSENVDIFEMSPHFNQLSFQPDMDWNMSLSSGQAHGQASGAQAMGFGDVNSPGPLPYTSHSGSFTKSFDDASRPMAPGLPRRLSRQNSADVTAKRQLFAASKTGSGEGRQHVLSVDSGCDDVFVEVGGEAGSGAALHHPHDSSLFPNTKRKMEVTFSTSSTVSILPNPYNRINHRIHSMIWCCNCLYYVFFCCLPAIHYMEQCDVEFNRNNQKRASILGRTASFMFFTGTLVTLSFLALIFFLAIFFAIY